MKARSQNKRQDDRHQGVDRNLVIPIKDGGSRLREFQPTEFEISFQEENDAIMFSFLELLVRPIVSDTAAKTDTVALKALNRKDPSECHIMRHSK